MPQIYSKKGSAYRLLRDWLVTYNKPFPGSKVFLWEWFFPCLDYETGTDRGRGYTLWYLWYPKGNTVYLKCLIAQFTCLLCKRAIYLWVKNPPIHLKAFFKKKKGNDFESAKREDIFQLLFSLLSLVLVTGKKYSKVTLQMVEIIHSISIHFPRLLWQPGLCHNYHNFIYSSGALWEVKQGGRNSD